MRYASANAPYSGNVMAKFSEKYVTDEKGNRIGVLLDIADYQKLLEELEELDAIRAYDVAKAVNEEEIPFEEAIVEIERSHQ